MINNLLNKSSAGLNKICLSGLVSFTFRSIGYNKATKSIYNKKKQSTTGNNLDKPSNTIDITESQKQFELNSNLEMKNLEKLIKRNNAVSEKQTNINNKTFESKNSTDSKIFKNSTQTKEQFIEKQEKEQEFNLKDVKEFDFDFFKKRNKDILNKEKGKNKKLADEDNENEDESVIDKKTLAKLQELINQDQEPSDKQNYKDLNNKIEDEPTPIESDNFEEKSILVNRPLKNFVWGLGQQTKQKKFKFTIGEYPSVESIVNFLEVNNLTDIIVVPTHKLGLLHLKENSILCSGHTTRHIYKVAKDMVVDLKKLNLKDLPFTPTVFGRRDTEWLLVEIGEIQVHFFVDTFRKENDLLERWLNPPPEDYKDWSRRLNNMFYGKNRLK